MRNIDSPSSYLSDSGAKKLNQTGGMLKNLKTGSGTTDIYALWIKITAKKPGVSDKYTYACMALGPACMEYDPRVS